MLLTFVFHLLEPFNYLCAPLVQRHCNLEVGRDRIALSTDGVHTKSIISYDSYLLFEFYRPKNHYAMQHTKFYRKSIDMMNIRTNSKHANTLFISTCFYLILYVCPLATCKAIDKANEGHKTAPSERDLRPNVILLPSNCPTRHLGETQQSISLHTRPVTTCKDVVPISGSCPPV